MKSNDLPPCSMLRGRRVILFVIGYAALVQSCGHQEATAAAAGENFSRRSKYGYRSPVFTRKARASIARAFVMIL